MAERTAANRKRSTGNNNIRIARQKSENRSGTGKKQRIPFWDIGGRFDYPLFTIILILLVFGIVMMFSASYAVAWTERQDSFFYVKRQAGFACLGLAAMFVVSHINYEWLLQKQIVRVIFVCSTILTVATKFIGIKHGGAKRWISIFGIEFQPSEITKLAFIIVIAYFTQKFGERIKDKYVFMVYAGALIISAGAVVIQPHLSCAIIIGVIGVIMIFVAGCRAKHMAVFLLIVGAGGILVILVMKAVGYDYMGDRIQSFLSPESDVTGVTFQTYQSIISVGSGGLFGLGLGNSRQKYSYLPESQNDFVFSIICEELGFVGAMLVVLLFLILVFRCYYIASRAKDKAGMMLCIGIGTQIGIQALMNIAVVTNAMPNTGISLPFFSYGGTALLIQLAEMGVVLEVSRKAALE